MNDSTSMIIVVLLLVHGPLIRYVKLRVVQTPGMPGTFSPPLTSRIPAYITTRASRTCRDACREC